VNRRDSIVLSSVSRLASGRGSGLFGLLDNDHLHEERFTSSELVLDKSSIARDVMVDRLQTAVVSGYILTDCSANLFEASVCLLSMSARFIELTCGENDASSVSWLFFFSRFS
jgi:hypothetical protein